MAEKVLTRRALNRATLARQMLLERRQVSPEAAIERLLGPQAQITEGPYQGLWSRLEDFHHVPLTELITSRRLLRATTMRGTLHLHTLPDMVGIRALVQPVIDRMWQSNFRKQFGTTDRQAAIAFGRALLDDQPMTSGALGKAMHQRFPEASPLSLSILMQVSDILVQIPPTRIWGSGHAPILSRIEKWVEPPEPSITLETLVLRYLEGFGPASVADMQAWCGLTRLGDVFAVLRDRLVVFTDENGREFFDLPDAPRPDPDTPAPPRFLPVYDNVFLGYADRARIVPDENNLSLMWGDGANLGLLLIDGDGFGNWRMTGTKKRPVLSIRLQADLKPRTRKALEREAEALFAFMTDGASETLIEFS